MWSRVDRKQAAVDLAEARGRALVVPFAHHGGVHRGVRRLAHRAGLRAIISSVDGQTPAARLDQILQQIREFKARTNLTATIG